MLKGFFKRLFCSHKWDFVKEDYDISVYKRCLVYKCRICGKEYRSYMEF